MRPLCVFKNLLIRYTPLMFVASAIALMCLQGCASSAKPTPIGSASAEPQQIRHVGGAWHWIERAPKVKNRIVRASGSALQEIVSASLISRYDMDADRLVWTAQEGKTWLVNIARADGKEAHTLWSGAGEPFGVKRMEGRVYWLKSAAAKVKDLGPFPSLQPSLQLFSVAEAGGEPTLVATLNEAGDGEVLGRKENALYVIAYRRGSLGSANLYRMDLEAEKAAEEPKRLVGIDRTLPALLTKEGDLYWTAPSQEFSMSQGVSAIHRIDKAGKREALSDWLTNNGVLNEVTGGVVFVDRDYPTALWRPGPKNVFPTTLPLPENFLVLAVGEGKVLLMHYASKRANPELYEIALP